MFDVTERKNVEQKIKESEQQYQTLAQISPVGIFRTNAAGSTTYVNPKWCQISGLSADEAMKEGWLQVVHPDDREKLTINWEISTQKQCSSSAEYRFIRPDGSIVWVIGHAVPEKNTIGDIVGYVGTITNISQLMLAEQSLSKSEEKFRTFFNESPIGMELYNADGIQTNANKASLDNVWNRKSV